jgi:RNA polymerase sigma-70 factor (ECF subfamily)
LEGLSDGAGTWHWEPALTQEQAAERFYRYLWPHRAAVLRTARYLAASAADADDLAQETFMRAFRHIDRFDTAGNAKGWLTTILRHVQIDRSRVRASALVAEARPLDPEGVAAAPAAPERDPRDVAAMLEAFSDQDLIEALRALPEEMRWTLLLADVEQMDYEEIAAVVDVPVGTVKSRVFRARRLLRDGLVGQVPRPEESEQRAGQPTGWRPT